MNNRQSLAELRIKMTELETEIKSKYRDALKEATSEIFEKFPTLENFSWTQYTPYFNDGEPCEFCIHADYPSATFAGEEEDELPCNVSETIPGQVGASVEEFVTELIKPFERTVQSLLGEGKVIISRTGIDVEFYDHD